MATNFQMTELPTWLQDYMNTAAARGLDLANTPFTPYTQQRVADFTPAQNQALQMLQSRVGTFDPLITDATALIKKLMSGDVGGFNPYLQSMIDQTMKDVQTRMADMNGASGSFGNSGVQQNIARTMTDAGNNARFTGYNQMFQNAMNAANQALQGGMNKENITANQIQTMFNAGGQQQQQQQNVMDANYNEFIRSQQDPFNKQQALLNSLGFNPSQTQVSSGAAQPGLLSGYLQ